jgi:signal transduction histidine kinase
MPYVRLFRELIGANPRILKSGDTDDAEYLNLWKKITSGHVWKGVFHNMKKSGELYWESASVAPVFDADGLITHFVAVKEDITEKRAFEESLIKSEEKYRILADELGKTNATKDKLFSIIAHDLRGPIGNFNQILEIYSSLSGSNEVLKENLLEELKRESDTIYEMLENLLFWSRIQQNAISIDTVHFNISELLNDTINIYKSRAGLKQIEVRYSGADNHITFADRETISLVLKNLLSNAIKFTPKNGIVSISLNKNNRNVEIRVEDTGVGINNEVLKDIFSNNDFYRSFGTDGEKGRGIGLILCKYFVEINNGSIRAESMISQGSKFFVTLPLY